MLKVSKWNTTSSFSYLTDFPVLPCVDRLGTVRNRPTSLLSHLFVDPTRTRCDFPSFVFSVTDCSRKWVGEIRVRAFAWFGIIRDCRCCTGKQTFYFSVDSVLLWGKLLNPRFSLSLLRPAKWRGRKILFSIISIFRKPQSCFPFLISNPSAAVALD